MPNLWVINMTLNKTKKENTKNIRVGGYNFTLTDNSIHDTMNYVKCYDTDEKSSSDYDSSDSSSDYSSSDY